MAEMGDAHVRGFVDEDRIAVPLGAAAPVADVGRDVAHAHVFDGDVVARRLIRRRAPAAQHVLDGGVGMIGEVGRVRVIHGDDVRHDRRPDIIVVVGCDAHELRRFDQEARVADIGDSDLLRIERDAQRGRQDARRIGGDEPGTCLRQLRLRRRRLEELECRDARGEKPQDGGERRHANKSSRAGHGEIPSCACQRRARGKCHGAEVGFARNLPWIAAERHGRTARTQNRRLSRRRRKQVPISAGT